MPIYLKGDKSVLFVHVPKTGGTSIERMLRSSGYKQYGHDGQGGPDAPNAYRHCPPQHWDADQLRSVYQLDRFTAVFMVVRDPLARLQSEFAYRLAWRNLGLSEDEVASWWGRIRRRYASNPYLMDNHIRPQSEFWLPASLVYRFEDGLDSVAVDLNERFDLGLSADVPHQKKSASHNGGVRSNEVPISDRMRKSVMEFYREDYQRFGY